MFFGQFFSSSSSYSSCDTEVFDVNEDEYIPLSATTRTYAVCRSFSFDSAKGSPLFSFIFWRWNDETAGAVWSPNSGKLVTDLSD